MPHVARRHAVVCFPVSFSITAPTSTVERAAAVPFGGLGAVHQYVTMKAFMAGGDEFKRKFDEWSRRSQRLSVESLLAGVIYNDFPGEDDADIQMNYTSQYLSPIDPNDAYYITDRRFLVQPNADMRWANAAVYKHIPEMLMAIAGVKRSTMQSANAMLHRRIKEDRVNYHFLRATRDETPRESQRRAIATAQQWYRRALEWRNLFLFGHIWHQMQDSFSPAHTRRTLAPTPDAPYGVIDEIYFFGDQGDMWHSRHESWDAVSRKGSEGDRRVEAAIPPLRDSLKQFIDDVENAPQLPLNWDWSTMDKVAPGQRNYAEQRAEVFGEWLRAKAYKLR